MHFLLLLGNRDNPFHVPPSYHRWAPWIGPKTRASNVTLNTEYAKLPVTQACKEPGDIDITEERLTDEVMKLKVNGKSN